MTINLPKFLQSKYFVQYYKCVFVVNSLKFTPTKVSFLEKASLVLKLR